jgi:broad specificity phosphatase PhoE
VTSEVKPALDAHPRPAATCGGDSSGGLPIAWLAAVVTLFAGAGSVAHAAESVWEALRTPGTVVVLRHSYAPGAFDPPDAKLEDCSTQRNLDANGRAQARRIGEGFRQHGIEVGAVLSSPRCRCLDTARLAFGRVEAWAPLGGALDDAELRRRQVVEIQQRMAEHRGGPPLVLVTHGSVVTDLTGLSVQMGAFVVLRRTADGSHAVAGQLYVD